jgi:hypothetical protein
LGSEKAEEEDDTVTGLSRIAGAEVKMRIGYGSIKAE